MRLLLLGGTQFLGRHVVQIALARGHEVTVFTRGQRVLPAGLRDAVTAMLGDRDPRVGPGLDALEHGSWDAVIDTSGYVPRIVEASATLLASRVARYLFVSKPSTCASRSMAWPRRWWIRCIANRCRARCSCSAIAGATR